MTIILLDTLDPGSRIDRWWDKYIVFCRQGHRWAVGCAKSLGTGHTYSIEVLHDGLSLKVARECLRALEEEKSRTFAALGDRYWD